MDRNKIYLKYKHFWLAYCVTFAAFSLKALPLEDIQTLNQFIESTPTLSSPIETINQITQSNDYQKSLARKIAQELNYYGQNSDEEMDPEYARELVKEFMYLLIPDLTSNVSTYNGIHFDIPKNELSVQNIRQKFIEEQLNEDYSTVAKQWLADLYFADKDPTFALQLEEDIIYGSYTWYVLYNASLIAQAIGLKPKDLTLEELVNLYQSHAQVLDDPSISEVSTRSMLAYAGVHDAIDVSNYADLSDHEQYEMTQAAVHFVQTKVTEITNNQHSIDNYVEVITRPIPTRKSVANKIILKKYGEMLTCRSFFIKERELIDAYLDHDISCLGTFFKLPNLTDEFNQSFNQYKNTKANNYIALTNKLAENLPSHLQNIVGKNSQQIIIPTLASSPGAYTRWEKVGSCAYNGACASFNVATPSWRHQWQDHAEADGGLIIPVTIQGKQRYIAATWHNKLMFNLLPSSIHNEQQLTTWLLANKASFFSENPAALAYKGQSDSILSIRTTSKSSVNIRDTFTQKIQAYVEQYKTAAYGETQYQQRMDLVLDILVPLHGLITAKDTTDRIISAYSDTLLLIPVVGAAAKVASSSAKIGVRLSMTSTKAALIQAVKVGGLAGGKQALQRIAQSTKLYKYGSKLGYSVVDALNPLSGLGALAKSTGTASLRTINKLKQLATPSLKAKINRLPNVTESLTHFSKQGDIYKLDDMTKLSKNSSGYNMYRSTNGTQLDLVNIKGDMIPAISSDNWRTFALVNPKTQKGFGKMHSTSTFQTAALQRSKITDKTVLSELNETATSGLYRDSLHNLAVEIEGNFHRVSQNPQTSDYFLASYSHDKSYKWKVSQQNGTWQVADDYVGLRGGGMGRLKAYEKLGGHVLDEHVHIDDMKILQELTYNGKNKEIIGRFIDENTAAKVIDDVITNNPSYTNRINKWLHTNNVENLTLFYTSPNNKSIGTLYKVPRKIRDQFPDLWDAVKKNKVQFSDLASKPVTNANIVLKRYDASKHASKLTSTQRTRIANDGYFVYTAYPSQ